MSCWISDYQMIQDNLLSVRIVFIHSSMQTRIIVRFELFFMKLEFPALALIFSCEMGSALAVNSVGQLS